MSEASDGHGPPRAILVATDLSARCDRALDRAVMLAEEWQATLVVLHVIENAGAVEAMLDRDPQRAARDPMALARRQLIRDVGEKIDAATLVIEHGRPADAIVRVAERESCGLIVLGIARDELFGRFSLGTTVDRLLRGAPAPLLVVRERPRRRYEQIAVATDFSESSRLALDAVRRLFPDRRPTLLHAYEPLMESLAPDLSSYRREARSAAIADAMAFAAGSAPPSGGTPPDVFVEQGDPVSVLQDYVADGNADLVALGSHGRSAIYEIFLGSTAKRVLERLPADALIIREPRAAVER